MSDAALPYAPPFRPGLAAVGVIGSALVTLGVFLSGFVIAEPAPYELFMAGLIGLWAIVGLRISRNIAPLLVLIVTYNVGGMLSLTVMRELGGGPMYIAVSLFLALSSVFFAAIIEARHQRLPLIMRAWVASALITALLGILGYFHAFPGSEVFTLYDRAKGAFQDPNVFGPFLVVPSLYLMHGLLTGKLAAAPLRVIGVLVLALGVFLSFSRAAWALYLFSVMENPLGIGPMVFSEMFPEDEHNIWLKSLTTYGWLGFVCYVTLIAWTLWLGLRYMLRDRPWQPYLMICLIALVGHSAIGFVIDTDHWRHFYLLLGVIWGCIALENRHNAS